MVMLSALLRRYVEGDQEGFRVRAHSTTSLEPWKCSAARSGTTASCSARPSTTCATPTMPRCGTVMLCVTTSIVH